MKPAMCPDEEASQGRNSEEMMDMIVADASEVISTSEVSCCNDDRGK